jgi:hypothetical protein
VYHVAFEDGSEAFGLADTNGRTRELYVPGPAKYRVVWDEEALADWYALRAGRRAKAR